MLRSQPRSRLATLTLGLWLPLLAADLLPESLDSLRTLAGLGKLQEQKPPPPPRGPPPPQDPPPWAGPWQAATAASGGPDARVSAAVDAGTGQLAAKAGAVAAAAAAVPDRCVPAPTQDAAVVTLITNNEGYPAGALAIAAALEVLGSQLRRIVLVTSEVQPGIQDLLRSASWEVMQVEPILCNQVLGAHVTPDRYDLGSDYQQKKAKWLTTCTKFHAWNLTFLKKVIFLDADTMPVKAIDSLAEHPSAFAAAPDTFPADQFNSGVMVLTPSAARFGELVAWNKEHGTAEGGDQCLLNEYFSEWFYNAWDHDDCGRLPWVMNIAAASYQGAKTLARMQSRDEPNIVHFVSGDGKPWLFMVLKFQNMQAQIPPAIQGLAHAWEQLYWLAKTNRICAGSLTSEEKQQARLMLDGV